MKMRAALCILAGCIWSADAFLTLPATHTSTVGSSHISTSLGTRRRGQGSNLYVCVSDTQKYDGDRFSKAADLSSRIKYFGPSRTLTRQESAPIYQALFPICTGMFLSQCSEYQANALHVQLCGCHVRRTNASLHTRLLDTWV